MNKRENKVMKKDFFSILFNIEPLMYGHEDDLYFVEINKSSTLYIELVKNSDGELKFYRAYVEDGEHYRRISTKGQFMRIQRLLELIDNDGSERLIKRVAKSIAFFEMTPHKVLIYRRKANGLAQFVGHSFVYRRDSFIRDELDSIVYFIDKSQTSSKIMSLIAKNPSDPENKNSYSIQDMEDITGNKVKWLSLTESDDMLVISMAIDFRSRFGKQRYILGGKAESGLVVLSEDIPVNNSQAQRLAKIKLSGGIKISVPVAATVSDFSHIDGVAIRLSDGDAERLAEAANLAGVPNWYQIRAFEPGLYAMKGTAQKAITPTLEVIGSHITTFVNKADYEKAYGRKVNIGDQVVISEWLILKTDHDFRKKMIHLAFQLISRAPRELQKQLIALAVRKIKAEAKKLQKQPLKQLPNWGFFKKMRSLDYALSSFGSKSKELPEFKTPEEALEYMFKNPDSVQEIDYSKSVSKNIFNIIKAIIDDGVEIWGHDAGLTNDETLGYDECKVGRWIAEDIGLKIGDRITIIRYPILYGDEKRNPNVFSKRIVRYIPGNTVALNNDAALQAGGDFDGDVAMLTTEFIAPPQIKGLDFTVSKGESLAWMKEPYDEKRAVEAFLLTASAVGPADVMYENISKWVGLSVKVHKYFMDVLQGAIFKMKHVLIDIFNLKNVSRRLKIMFPPERYPQMWERKEDGRYVLRQHPDVELRKSQAFVNAETLDELMLHINSVKEGLTPAFRAIVETLVRNIRPIALPTMTPEEFRASAKELFIELEDKMTDDLMKIKDAVINFIFNIEGELDQKNALIKKLAANIKAVIGTEAFYLLVLSMFADKRFGKNLFFAFMFADITSIRDIQRGNRNIIFTNVDFTLDLSEEGAVAKIEASKASEEVAVTIWRPRKEGGNNIIIKDGEAAVEIKDGKAILEDSRFHINEDKSNPDILENDGTYYIIKHDKIGTSGYRLIVELMS